MHPHTRKCFVTSETNLVSFSLPHWYSEQIQEIKPKSYSWTQLKLSEFFYHRWKPMIGFACNIFFSFLLSSRFKDLWKPLNLMSVGKKMNHKFILPVLPSYACKNMGRPTLERTMQMLQKLAKCFSFIYKYLWGKGASNVSTRNTKKGLISEIHK